MKNSLITKKLAKGDILEANSWYENKKKGLGKEFLNELEDIYNRIQNNPNQFPVINHLYRKAVLRKFPFIVFFIIEEDKIYVIAVFHVSRNPNI